MEHVIPCPVSELPIVSGELCMQRIENRLGYYHYLETKPILFVEKFFKKNLNKMFAIVSIYELFENFRIAGPGGHLMGYTCPVMSTWIAANGKTILLPPEIPNLEETDPLVIWKWIFPKFGWNEYYVLPAIKKPEAPKMFYCNPCDIVSFWKSCAGIVGIWRSLDMNLYFTNFHNSDRDCMKLEINIRRERKKVEFWFCWLCLGF
jgi:hypothetical protein